MKNAQSREVVSLEQQVEKWKGEYERVMEDNGSLKASQAHDIERKNTEIGRLQQV